MISLSSILPYSIQPEHATIDHDGVENKIFVIPGQEAKVKVNGIDLVEKGELKHGDRYAVGL